MKAARFISISILGLTLASFSSISAQTRSGVIVLFARNYSAPHLQIWLLGETSGEIQSVAEIDRNQGQIHDFLVDIANKNVYFIRSDTEYGPIGENRIVRYHWPTDTEEVIYTQLNIFRISQHLQENKLLVWYYAEDREYANQNTPVFSCLLDIIDQICDEFGGQTPVQNSWGAHWIWLNNTQALQLNTFSTDIELVDTEVDEIRPVVSIEDVHIIYWQENPSMSGILLIGVAADWWEDDGEIEYLFYHLDPRTFEISFLSSSLTPYRIEVPYLALSSDGKYLAFLQQESLHEQRDSDHLRVVEIETGNLVYSSPLTTISSSGDELLFDYYSFKWTADSTRLLGIAFVPETQTHYVTQRNVSTGAVDLMTPIESGAGFVEPWRIRQ